MKVGFGVQNISLTFLICAFWCISSISASNNTKANVSEILNSFFASGYDSRVRPNYGGPPVQVNASMLVNDISSVSEVQMEFTLDFYFRQYWNDERLKFNPVGGIDRLELGADMLRKIWSPDTFFANEKQASLHIGTSTATNTLLRIEPNGDILYSTRITVTASCQMNLKYFPMDKQKCYLEIENYGYSMSDIVYYWAENKNPFGFQRKINLPQFRIAGYKYFRRVEQYSVGNFSQLMVEIQFSRSLGYYLIQVYIPASLIVIISWVPFWLDRDDCHARVALGVTTVLTITTLVTNTNEALPKISYIKSIDVYLGTCFTMVFMSLLEYAVVGYFGIRSDLRRFEKVNSLENESNHKTKVSDGHAEKGSNEVVVQIENSNKCLERPKNAVRILRVRTSRMDNTSRIIFPLCFICFNLLYWSIYLHISDSFNDNFVSEI